MSFTIVSFFTEEWEYPHWANLLQQKCQEYGFNHHIEKKETTHDYIKNTALKPFFIRECRTKIKGPIVWIDVDALMIKRFELNFHNVDILAAKHHNPKLNRDWAVAFLGFNDNDIARIFLNKWCENTTSGTDENSFDLTWREIGSQIRIQTLSEQFHFVKWSNNLKVPDDTIICHQLSKSPDKLRRKFKIEKQ